jgi:hypothetical protein
MRRMIAGNKARSERWKREDEAPRLKEKIPTVSSLRLELEELAEERPIVGTRRVRHIVVDQAAALFEIPCSDSKCENGGHDVTRQIMEALAQRQQAFEFQSACAGESAQQPCGRVLAVSASAEYDNESDA